MRPDIAVGLFTIAMAVLGGIVSAHAPQRFSQKCVYIAGFFLFAVFGLFFVVRLSNETAVANAQLSDALGKLRDLTIAVSRQTQQITDAQNKNNELQKALLALSARTGALSKEILAQTTGGESFAFFLAQPRPAPPFPLSLFITGKHPMHNVAAQIQESLGPGEFQRQLQSIHWIPLGDTTKLPGAYTLVEQVGIGQYFFRIMSANGMMSETLDLKMKDGKMNQSMSVSRDGKKLYEMVDGKVTVPYVVR